jgi:hypothetical protein
MKKGYFFMIDAFLSISIIILSLIIVYSFQSSRPYQAQGISQADDVMTMLSGTKIYQLNNEFVKSLYVGAADNITNPENTLLEQIGEFLVTGNDQLAIEFTMNVSPHTSPNYGYELLIYNSTTRYNITLSGYHTPQNESEFLVTSKTLIAGVVDPEFYWGPMVAEVRVWK